MGIPGGCAGRLKLEAETFPARMKMLEPAWTIERKARLRSAFKTGTGLAGLEVVPANDASYQGWIWEVRLASLTGAADIGTARAYSQHRDRLVTVVQIGFS
ncbi:hypothetical protein [Pararhizobium sp.]|uniref:hypothetical protein n=1 Tax=Pararhizobium sp. TaxID=1977563 RepID=UPI003D0C48CD